MSARSYDVLLGDEGVGLLTEYEDGRIVFRFSDAYRRAPRRAVLSQSFEDDLGRTYAGKRPNQLPAFFSNLLPEGRFREMLEKSLGVNAGDDLGLLAAACNDLPGAVSLRPTQEALAVGALDPAQGDTPMDNGDALGLRFSLAGVQLKFSMVRQDDRLTLPAHGRRGDWIVKVASPEYAGLAENEYSMMEWARAAGFDVPECELIEAADVPQLGRYAAEGTRVFAVRRFDRAPGRRIHQEDFMQVFGWPNEPKRKYDSKYEELARIVRALLGDDGYEAFVGRLVLVVATGNNDAHLKNWALLYPKGALPALAPAYDQVSTVAWPQHDRELALKLAGARAFGRVEADSFRRLAVAVGASAERTVELARETLARLLDAWKRIGSSLPLPRQHVAALADHWRRVPLLRESGDIPVF